MMRSLLYTSLLLVLSIKSIIAQSPDLKETFLEAESYFLFEEYNEALPLYLRIHRADPENDNINYKIGVCLLNDPYQKDRSIRYLEEASKNINPKYKENNFKETTAPPEAFFYLGNAYLVNDNIDKAIENYTHFRDILDEKIYDVELVEEQIRICERARSLKKMPVDYDVKNIGETINTRFSDINPIISGNGKRLVYVSEMQFYDATFFSEKVDDEWQPPRNIIPELGVDGDVYPTALSWDGNTMIIYRNDDFVGNLYVSRYEEGKWTAMEKLGDNINTKYWESHGSLSKDGSKLYFTSNRKGGFGGLDIYVSEKQPNGSWGIPVNLGPTINSRYNEETPFITENGKTLYFSSYGHYNMGGYDVFYSIVDEEGNWGLPVNLGYPINTTDDDLFYHPVNNGDNAYFAKFFDEGFGRHDIYYLDVYSENNPRIYIVTGALGSDKGKIKTDDNLLIYLIDRTTQDTVQVGQPDFANQTFEIKAPQGDYDLLLRSTTFNDLEKRIRIDEMTEKTGIRIDEILSLETKPYEPLLLTGNDSRIEIDDTLFFTKPGEKLKIRMNLAKGATLYARHSIDSITIASDTFSINRSRFVYEMITGKGTNLVDLVMIEDNGDKSLTQVVIYTDDDEEIADTEGQADTEDQTIPGEMADRQPASETVDKPESERAQLQNDFNKLTQYAKGELKEILENTDLEALGINSIDELFKHLDSQQADQKQLEELKVIHLVDNGAAELLELMIKNSEGELEQYLRGLDLQKEGITTANELIDHLKRVAEENGFNENDLLRTFKKINGTITEAEKLIDELIPYAKGDLYNYLKTLDLTGKKIITQAELLDHLVGQVGKEFEPEQLISLLSDLVIDKPVDEFIRYLMANGPKELRDFVREIDLEKEKIETIAELIAYLIKHADQMGLTEEELQLLLIDLLANYATASIPETDSVLQRKEISSGLKITGGLLFTGILIFIIFFLRKRRKEDETDPGQHSN
jgi:hypothetical protein